MAVNFSNKVTDGMTSFAGGQDAGRNPNLINPDQCEQMENCVCRGGKIGPRPRYRKMTLNFANNVTYTSDGGHSGVNPVGSQSAFKDGLFQCASFYDPSLDVDCLMASIGGRLFQCVPGNTSVEITELSLDVQNRPNIPKAYMVQADRFHITQDGENTPIIFDGVVARRAGKDEIFTGKQMAYGQGRIVLVGKNERDIYFGDLYGSHEGEPGASVLQFTETTFLSEGGAASLPFTLGHCRGLAFIPEQDTSMGQGQLFAFAEKGAASFFLDLPRDQWKQSKFQALALIDVGAVGDLLISAVNSDIWFRAKDGWRAYRKARADAKGWFQLALSNEVKNYIDVETENLLSFGSAIHFNNRLVTTCTPIPNQGRPYNNGFLALDFSVLTSFGDAIHKPSWDGHWTDLKTTQIVTGEFGDINKAFAFGLDENGQNAIYELSDDIVEDTAGPVEFSFVPRSYTFNQYFNEGKLDGGDIWFDTVKGDTTVEVYFRPDNYQEWLPWHTANHSPLNKLTPIGKVGQIQHGTPTLRQGFYPRRTLEKPNVGTDSQNTKRDLRRGYEFHQKIVCTGNASVNRVRVFAAVETEKAKATIP